jgi:anti-anti-sigma regulatory factor
MDAVSPGREQIATELETLDTGVVLHLRGNLSVVHAAELHKRLLAAFECAGEIEVDCSEVTDLDLSAIQLLSTAQRKALTTGRSFNASPPLPEVVKERFALAGLDPFQAETATRVAG